ncbi:MAG: PadR family transcriptional regulator [Candidatus Aminicenantes bacterium]|nr:PadR family transcriptional regulator [Candidatus Aminicenantes bacterium]
MNDLNLVEEMILWAVWRLGDNAYGVTIRRKLSEDTNRLFPYGTLYGVLAKLDRWRYVKKTEGEPSPVRGGRTKYFYTITAKGREALKRVLELRQTIWDSDSILALKREK